MPARWRLRSERGSAVVEFPLITVLILLIALAIIQAALIMYARNALTDAAVQGAHHASPVGNTPADGAVRTQRLVDERFGGA